MAARPLFLARGTYRLRRRMDAARLLPLLGAFLFLLPVFWTAPPAPPAPSSPAALSDTPAGDALRQRPPLAPAGATARRGEDPSRTGPTAVYLFAVWAGLIVAAFLLSRALADAAAENEGAAEPRG